MQLRLRWKMEVLSGQWAAVPKEDAQGRRFLTTPMKSESSQPKVLVLNIVTCGAVCS